MAKICILLGLLCCLSLNSKAERVVTKSDSRLIKLQQALSPGWIMDMRGDTMIIENEQPSWVLRSNFINVPAQELERDNSNKEKIMNNGIKTRSRLVFVLRDKKLLTKTDLAKAHYFSTHFALFEFSVTGIDTPYTRYYPYSIEEETSSIYYALLRKHLKMGLGPVYSTP